jgi:hypothetical protein
MKHGRPKKSFASVAMADGPFSTAAGAMIKHSMMGSTWQIQIQDK